MWRHRSRDLSIRHTTFPIGGLLESSLCLQPLWRYWALSITGVTHDLDLSVSRDIVGQVSIRFAIGHILSVVLCNRASISVSFEIFGSKALECWIVRYITWYVGLSWCKIYVHILMYHQHFAYSLCHYYWATMKNKGCSLSGLLMFKRKIERKSSKSKNVLNYDLWRLRGTGSSDFYPQKAHPCVNPCCLSHFACRQVDDLYSRHRKVRKSQDRLIGTRCRRKHIATGLLFTVHKFW